ncbi:hypothetical protein [Nocardia sp. NPDC057668]|uniref:hypothetical protein n=1 Tax=Nocardia sp. NPDC057668 TaxID=3346202 RepID=UPI00366DEF5F
MSTRESGNPELYFDSDNVSSANSRLSGALEDLAKVLEKLNHGTPDSSVLGDSNVTAACTTFRDVWRRESHLTISATDTVISLVSRATVSFKEADRNSATAIAATIQPSTVAEPATTPNPDDSAPPSDFAPVR